MHCGDDEKSGPAGTGSVVTVQQAVLEVLDKTEGVEYRNPFRAVPEMIEQATRRRLHGGDDEKSGSAGTGSVGTVERETAVLEVLDAAEGLEYGHAFRAVLEMI